jgi:hypothetical protein
MEHLTGRPHHHPHRHRLLTRQNHTHRFTSREHFITPAGTLARQLRLPLPIQPRKSISHVTVPRSDPPRRHRDRPTADLSANMKMPDRSARGIAQQRNFSYRSPMLLVLAVIHGLSPVEQ